MLSSPPPPPWYGVLFVRSTCLEATHSQKSTLSEQHNCMPAPQKLHEPGVPHPYTRQQTTQCLSLVLHQLQEGGSATPEKKTLSAQCFTVTVQRNSRAVTGEPDSTVVQHCCLLLFVSMAWPALPVPLLGSWPSPPPLSVQRRPLPASCIGTPSTITSCTPSTSRQTMPPGPHFRPTLAAGVQTTQPLKT